jgi:HEAT repeat protein
VAGQPGSFWTAEQQKTYNEVKAILDRGEVPISPQRRALDDVCDQLATKLADPTQPGNWAAIRDLLIGVNTYAVSPVMKHVLVANAPEQVRLEGIIVLVSVKEAVQPKDGIVKALKDPSPAVRWWAIHGVVDKQYGDAGEAVATLVLDENPEVSLTAAKAVATLKVPKAEGCLVSMVARELARRAPLVQQLADLETQRKALQDKVGRTSDEDQQVTALGQRIDEASGRISFSTLVIYRVGEALSALTNKADGSELTRAMSDADLQKVIDRLQTKYPPPAAR